LLFIHSDEVAGKILGLLTERGTPTHCINKISLQAAAELSLGSSLTQSLKALTTINTGVYKDKGTKERDSHSPMHLLLYS